MIMGESRALKGSDHLPLRSIYLHIPMHSNAQTRLPVNSPRNYPLPWSLPSCLHYLDIVHRPILSIRLDQPHLPNNPHPLLNPSEDSMFPIKMRCGRKRNEEL